MPMQVFCVVGSTKNGHANDSLLNVLGTNANFGVLVHPTGRADLTAQEYEMPGEECVRCSFSTRSTSFSASPAAPRDTCDLTRSSPSASLSLTRRRVERSLNLPLLAPTIGSLATWAETVL